MDGNSRTLRALAPADWLPPPAGHYTPSIMCDGVLYVSGQLPVGAGTEIRLMSFCEQMRQALKNLEKVLLASGSRIDLLAKVTIYIVGIENWAAADASFGEFMGRHRPARSIIGVAGLHYGSLVAVDAIAYSTNDNSSR